MQNSYCRVSYKRNPDKKTILKVKISDADTKEKICARLIIRFSGGEYFKTRKEFTPSFWIDKEGEIEIKPDDVNILVKCGTDYLAIEKNVKIK